LAENGKGEVSSMMTSGFPLLEQLINDQSERQQEAIQELIALGEHALPCLIGALEMSKYQQAWPRIMHIIQQIGGPKSLDVIPVLLRFLKDSNKPPYEPAFETLRQMGERVVNSVHDILVYCWSDDSWIQGVCALLEEIDSVDLDVLLSGLLHLLEIGTDENCLDEYAIGPLRKIGSPKADAAIPLLIERIDSRRSEDIRMAAMEALTSFDLQTAQDAIPTLQAVLADPSERIRNEARKVLEWIQETESSNLRAKRSGLAR
jgi:HEAT repeat protein